MMLDAADGIHVLPQAVTHAEQRCGVSTGLSQAVTDVGEQVDEVNNQFVE